jgi:acyl-CoA synthetase (AMP-forming)/AMP-acid ligase II
MIDLVDMIFFHASAHPEKPAVITSEATLTYGMLRRGILAAQRQLRLYGIKRGDRVGISVFNAVGHVALICALHRAGVVSVSLDKPQTDFLNEGVIDALLTNNPISGTSTRMVPIDESWFDGEIPDEIGPNVANEVDGGELCRLVMSSGTTGRPKIIALSYEAVRERCISYSIRLSTPSWDRIVCTPGLSTNYGYSFCVTTLWLGRTICFAFDATARQLILSHRAELLVASTHQIVDIVKIQEESFNRMDSLRAVHIGGSVAYAPLLARIRLLVCSQVFCGYGSTEGGTVAYTPSEAVFGMDRAVGFVVPWVDVDAIDDQKAKVAYGKEGEIRIRALGQGYQYLKNPDGKYAAEANDWFHPGDQGIIFRNGMMVISGRLNEIINRGGTKVSPDTIEEIVQRHPLVADAAAVGMLDPVGLEQIWLGVVTRGGGEVEVSKLYEYVRETAPQYVPDRIFQISEVPRNRLGKVARETLKEKLKGMEEAQVLTVR